MGRRAIHTLRSVFCTIVWRISVRKYEAVGLNGSTVASWRKVREMGASVAADPPQEHFRRSFKVKPTVPRTWSARTNGPTLRISI
jgi:hypothetical protein